MEAACKDPGHIVCLGDTQSPENPESNCDSDKVKCPGSDVTDRLFECVANSTNSIKYVDDCRRLGRDVFCREADEASGKLDDSCSP